MQLYGYFSKFLYEEAKARFKISMTPSFFLEKTHQLVKRSSTKLLFSYMFAITQKMNVFYSHKKLNLNKNKHLSSKANNTFTKCIMLNRQNSRQSVFTKWQKQINFFFVSFSHITDFLMDTDSKSFDSFALVRVYSKKFPFYVL